MKAELLKWKQGFINTWNRVLSSLQIREVDNTCFHCKQPTYDQLYSTLNAIPDLMFELDREGRHLDYRVLTPDILVAPIEQLMGHTVSEVMPPAAAHSVMQAIEETVKNGYSRGTHILLPTPAGEKWFEISIGKKQQKAGEQQKFIVLSRDITERKAKQIETERLAFLDALTELPNRHALKTGLMKEIQSNQESLCFGALLFLDLDNFKALNDSKGHNQGDLLLTILSKRLLASVRQSDLVVRWGGDEFVILLSQLADNRAQAEHLARQICEQIKLKTNAPYELNDCLYTCHISIGVRLFNNLDSNVEEIIQHADDAMYTAKKSGNQAFSFHVS